MNVRFIMALEIPFRVPAHFRRSYFAGAAGVMNSTVACCGTKYSCAARWMSAGVTFR